MAKETKASEVANPEGESDILSGQYLILINYESKPEIVSQTTVTRSKAALLDRTTYKPSSKSTEPEGQVVELLSAYKKLSGYSIVGNESAGELSIFHAAKLEMAFARETGKSLELVKDAPKHRLYVSKSLDIKSINRGIEKFWHAQKSGYAVNNAIFVGMVSMFDELVAKLIRESLKAVPDLINSFSLDIPYRDIVAAGDFDELKKNIIDATVQSLMWKGRAEQLKWIEKNITKNEFSKSIPNYLGFMEVAERRNVYVHNDGIASREYYDRLTQHGVKFDKAEVGKRLRLNQTYFLDAADALIEAYIVISQSVIRKITKNAPSETKQVIDSQFNEASYYQIGNDRCASAARIARCIASEQFAVADIFKKMATINLAIATKKCGDDKEGEAIIQAEDWSSAKDEFKLCIAAITENMDDLESLIPRLKDSDWVSPEVYFEWPAFDWVRPRPEFWHALERVYGDEIKKIVDSTSDGSTSSMSQREIDP